MTLAQSDLRKLVAKIALKAKTNPAEAHEEALRLVSTVYFEAGLVFEELEKADLIRGSGVGVARNWAEGAKAEVISRWRK